MSSKAITTLNELSIQSLEEKIQENSQKSIFGGRVYLAYNENVGFYQKELNWVQVILRYFFSCYKDTHLQVVGLKLKNIQQNSDLKSSALTTFIMTKFDKKFNSNNSHNQATQPTTVVTASNTTQQPKANNAPPKEIAVETIIITDFQGQTHEILKITDFNIYFQSAYSIPRCSR